MKKSSSFYILTLSYHGLKYYGWQKQPGLPSIQGELEKAMRQVFPEFPAWSLSAGRTDAGVSALNLIVQIQLPIKIDGDQYLPLLNSYLPAEIRAKSISLCPDDFQVIKDIKSKEYLYFFSNQPSGSGSFAQNFVVNFEEPLNFEKINQCCQCFIGTHDFKNFKDKGVENSTTVRTIYHCEIVDGSDWISGIMFPEKIYALKICGDGFLKQMVRIIMGTLVNVGNGKVNIEEVKIALNGATEKKVGFIAPPTGLFANETIF